MPGRQLYCTKCGEGIVVDRDDRDVPAQCPKCGSSTWRSAQHPSVPYALTFNDARFLRSIRIATDD